MTELGRDQKDEKGQNDAAVPTPKVASVSGRFEQVRTLTAASEPARMEGVNDDLPGRP